MRNWGNLYNLLIYFLLSGSLFCADDQTFDIYSAVNDCDIEAIEGHLDMDRIDQVIAYAAKIGQQEVVEYLLHKKGQLDIQENFIATLRNKKAIGLKLSVTEALFLKWSMQRAQELAVNVSKVDRVNRGYTGFHQMVVKVGQIEAAMKKQGYTTFVHARNWDWNFVKDVWNLIYALQHDYKKIPHQIHLRQRDNSVSVDELYQMRKELIEHGAGGIISGTYLTGKESEVIFMNRTALSNMEEWGEFTGRYFLQNHSTRGSTPGYDFALELLKRYGLQEYQKQIDELYQFHKSLTKHGEMLCISVHNDYVNDLVYLAYPNGAKYQHDDHLGTLASVREFEYKTDQENDFFEDGNDNDTLIYCLVVPDIPGEDSKKYKIESVHLSDDTLYRQYQEKLQALLEDIKEDGGLTKEVKKDGGLYETKKKKRGIFGFALPWFTL